MCGRYALFGPISRYSRWFNVDDEAVDCPPRYNVAPSLVLPVVRQLPDGRRHFVLARWGLIPYWVRDPASLNKPVNAKVENAPMRAMFREAWQRRRVLVPADGFYEWLAQGGRKQPYFLRLKSKEPLGLGGLYEEWRGPEGPLATFTLLTTEPNELVRTVHDRMPVIIRPDDYADWLDPHEHDTARLAAMTSSYPSELMEMYPVSMRVNRPAEEGADLIEPLVTCE
jgi:putative SOS response-associated peptidase YedK